MSQLQRPSDGGTHSMEVGGEKKSVLKKVKDKAKKMKESIKRHGHRHRQEEDHKVHGEPVDKSPVVRETNLENPKDDDDDHHHPASDNNKALAPENKNDLPKTDPNKPKIDQSPVRFGEGEGEGEEDPNCQNETPTSNNNHSNHSTPTGDNSGSADLQDSANKPLSESATASEYAHKIAETVYEKVAGAGSAVVSMVHPNKNEDESENASSSSVKEYLSEKLRPGDDDKALSEAITDALHKREEEEEESEPEKPRAKVTVSKEVAERLGMDKRSKREGEDAVTAGEESTGDGFVERLENAFTSWLSTSDGIQTAQDSLSNAFVNNPSSASGGGGSNGGGVQPN